MNNQIKPKEATAVINSLMAGVVPKIGVQHITVGRSKEVQTVIESLEQVKNGHSLMKYWVGDFGSGKSFMLHLINTVALKQKFVVTTVDLTPHIRFYSNDGKAQAFYTALVDNLAIQTRPEGGALPVLLEKWIEKVIVQTATLHGLSLSVVRAPEHLPLIEQQMMKTISEVCETGAFDFGLVVAKYYEGFITQNDDLRKSALRWLRAEYTTKTEARKELGVSDIIHDRNYYNMLKSLCKLFVSIGYSGLLVNVDEVINLYKIISPGVRQKNYETLLSIYNNCFQGRVEHLFFNIATATIALEDTSKGIYSYAALKTRLKTNKFETAAHRDLAQPVIRLFPLSHDEIFVLLKNLKEIFELHYQTQIDFSYKDIHKFMEETYNKPGAAEFLTPRAVIRDFLNILNVIRQNPAVDKQQLFDEIAIEDEDTDKMQNESSKEEQLKQKQLRIKRQCKGVVMPSELLMQLSDMLLDEENILKLMSGIINNQAGHLMATEKRLIFIDKKHCSTSFAFNSISVVSYTPGKQHSTLHLTTNNTQVNVEYLPNGPFKVLVNLLESQLEILERKTLWAELTYWEKKIAHKEVKNGLQRMVKIAYIIHEKNPEGGTVFFARHGDTLNKLLRQLYLLEVADVDSEEARHSKDKLVETLLMTRQAFEQELSNSFSGDLLDVDAESEAYILNLKSKGLLNELQ